MIDDLTLEKVKNFPPKYQDEVKDFIEFIEEKKIHLKENIRSKRGFGSAKGILKYMADDFDEPLEDFKEYM